MCSSCNDKTSKCPHGVQSADECKDGCDIGEKAIAKKASSLVEESEEGADEDVEHDVAALQEEGADEEVEHKDKEIRRHFIHSFMNFINEQSYVK